jgi:hypothetical protein
MPNDGNKAQDVKGISTLKLILPFAMFIKADIG